MAWRAVTDKQWELSGTFLAQTSKGRAATGRRPQVLRGYPLDSLDRRAGERTARAVRREEHGTPATGRVGRVGGALKHVAGLPRPARRPEEGALGRVLHRRHVHPG